ncbi:MAG: hypothetical protein A3G75_01570, partial [Verrucomicrobia bacterium RIFCSPLOWO2_12_FULL_64_8]
MKTPLLSSLGILFLAAACFAAVAAMSLRADPPRRDSRSRSDSKVDVSVSIGARLPHGYVRVDVGRDPYYYHRGVFYRQGPRGYVVTRAPRGAIVRELPSRYVRFYVGGTFYYRYSDVYYTTCPDGYVVVDPPPAVLASAPVPAEAPGREKGDYQSVWFNETEYLFKDGQFFRRTPDGLVWIEAPLGAVTKALPADAMSVW